MDATGTIIGLRKNVRNWLLSGMRHSSISASTMARMTASGTAMTENDAVFFAAKRKIGFLMSVMKFSSPVNAPAGSVTE